jgi:hypothetical protein
MNLPLIKTSLGLWALVLFASHALAQSPQGKVSRCSQPQAIEINGLDYQKARARILKAGWQPLKTNQKDTANLQDGSGGNGPYFLKKGYSEVESCLPTGTAGCIFNFHKNKDVFLRVYTQGEEGEGYHAGVTSYEFFCKQ